MMIYMCVLAVENGRAYSCERVSFETEGDNMCMWDYVERKYYYLHEQMHQTCPSTRVNMCIP